MYVKPFGNISLKKIFLKFYLCGSQQVANKSAKNALYIAVVLDTEVKPLNADDSECENRKPLDKV